MAAKITKTGDAEWEATVKLTDAATGEELEETYPITKRGRSFEVWADDERVGEADTLKGAGELVDRVMAGEVVGDDEGEDSPAGGGPSLHLWLQPSGEGTVHVMRQFPGQAARSILHLSADEADQKLHEQVAYHEGRGYTVGGRPAD